MPGSAKEYYVGEPVVQNEPQTVPHYHARHRDGADVEGAAMGPNTVHLEVDVHATKGEKRGFKEDEWIPT